MENGQSVFFLSPHTCEARALRARKTLTPRFTDFFTDFEKKPTVLQSTFLNTLRAEVFLLHGF